MSVIFESGENSLQTEGNINENDVNNGTKDIISEEDYSEVRSLKF